MSEKLHLNLLRQGTEITLRMFICKELMIPAVANSAGESFSVKWKSEVLGLALPLAHSFALE